MLNMWASWCIPCQQKAPILNASARAHVRDVTFIGIDVRDLHRDALDFLRSSTSHTSPCATARTKHSGRSASPVCRRATTSTKPGGSLPTEQLGQCVWFPARILDGGCRHEIANHTAANATASIRRASTPKGVRDRRKGSTPHEARARHETRPPPAARWASSGQLRRARRAKPSDFLPA